MPQRSQESYVEEVWVNRNGVNSNGTSNQRSGYGDVRRMRAQLDVASASGLTPTLDVLIEDTVDGVNYNTVKAFTQATAVGRQVIDVTSMVCDRMRVRWTVGGSSPSFDFTVKVASLLHERH